LLIVAVIGSIHWVPVWRGGRVPSIAPREDDPAVMFDVSRTHYELRVIIEVAEHSHLNGPLAGTDRIDEPQTAHTAAGVGATLLQEDQGGGVTARRQTVPGGRVCGRRHRMARLSSAQKVRHPRCCLCVARGWPRCSAGRCTPVGRARFQRMLPKDECP